MRRKPIPHRNIQRRRSRIPQVLRLHRRARPHIHRSVCRELRRVNPVCPVQRKLRKIACPRRRHVILRRLQRLHCGLYIGIILPRRRIHRRSLRNHRRRAPVRQRVRRSRIGKQQDPQLQTGILRQQLRILLIALPLLQLQLRLQHVRMGHFPTLLQLLRQVHKAACLIRRLLRHAQLLLRRQQSEILLHYGKNQPAPRHFPLRRRLSRRRIGPLQLRNAQQPQRLRNHRLARIFMNGIIGDKNEILIPRAVCQPAPPARFCIQIFVVVANVRQQARPRNPPLSRRGLARRHRIRKSRSILLRPRNCFIQRNHHRSR